MERFFDSRLETGSPCMAIFRVVTFFIHAIVAALASMLAAVFTHVLPAVIAGIILLGVAFALCTTCGIGGLAFLRKRKSGD